MKVTYPGPATSVLLPGDVEVAAGETVEVGDDLGASLVEQGWTATKSPKSAKAADAAEEAQS